MGNVLGSLGSKDLHFIFCTLPNDSQHPQYFDEQRIMGQLRSLGINHVIHLHEKGYAFRLPYKDILRRYGLLWEKSFPIPEGDLRDLTQGLLDSQNIPTTSYTKGKTKLFIKDLKTLQSLEEKRKEALENFSQKITAAECPTGSLSHNPLWEYTWILWESFQILTIHTRQEQK